MIDYMHFLIYDVQDILCYLRVDQLVDALSSPDFVSVIGAHIVRYI